MRDSDSTRRRHTAEFKHQAVMLVTKQDLSLAEAARRLGIHSNLLRNWKRSLEKNGAPASPKQPSALEAENARLLKNQRGHSTFHGAPCETWQ